MTLIDYKKPNEYYKKDNFYRLQLEISDGGYQECINCYMNAVENKKNVQNIHQDGSFYDIYNRNKEDFKNKKLNRYLVVKRCLS